MFVFLVIVTSGVGMFAIVCFFFIIMLAVCYRLTSTLDTVT